MDLLRLAVAVGSDSRTRCPYTLKPLPPWVTTLSHNKSFISTKHNVLEPPFSEELSVTITSTEEQSSRRREQTIAFKRIGNDDREWQRENSYNE
jgi:hypothetical protein